MSGNNGIYNYFLTSKSAKQWNRFGAKRRAGILAPLFSIFSENSAGIGEIPDIKLLVEWCAKIGASIIQLLPMNDVGFDFAPYSCQSTFALEPMYLSLEKIAGIDVNLFEKDIKKIKKDFPAGKKRVNYGIKKAKLAILSKMFDSIEKCPEEYEDFVEKNHFWINDYAVFKVLKEENNEKEWESWEDTLKNNDGESVENFRENNFERVNFHIWMQWQLYLQFRDAKKYANSKGVFIQGDLPFLVARDSSDVWAHQHYFNLDFSSGAPPDMYFAKGQRWGMPTYKWDNIENNKFDYLIEKVKLAQNFYDMFRIDHFVGLFRLWTISLDEPADTYGLKGRFDPENEGLWKEHGQTILLAMTDNSNMLPCAEDLGVVPACSYETLKEFAIPGMDVQRWTRDWGNTYDFKPAERYRENSVAIISSHDMTPLVTWWENEASTVDAMLVAKDCEEKGFDHEEVRSKLFDATISSAGRLRWRKEINTPEEVLKVLGRTRDQAWMFYDMHRESYDEKTKFLKLIGMEGADPDRTTKDFIRAAIRTAGSAASIFCIQLLQDLLSLGDYFEKWDKYDLRVNTPGSTGDRNWSIVMPLSLEKMLNMDINKEIMEINKETNRI